MGEFSTSISYCSPWYTYVSISHCYLHWIINILYKKTSKQTHEKNPLMLIFAPRIVAEMPDGAFMSLNWDINGIHIKSSKLVNFAGWWFGTWLLFFHILRRIIPTVTHSIIFQRGRLNHQPEMVDATKRFTTGDHHRFDVRTGALAHTFVAEALRRTANRPTRALRKLMWFRWFLQVLGESDNHRILVEQS